MFQYCWTREVVSALTTQVLCQYLRFLRLLSTVVLGPLMSDCFVYKWSPDGKYSASSAYRAFFVGAMSLAGAKELKVKAPPRVKFFFWLALRRRLWTVERRKRHVLQEADDCALCG